MNKFTRFPDWGYEVGVELIMDILIREEEHEMVQIMNNLSFDRKYGQGLQWLNKRLTGVRFFFCLPATSCAVRALE